MHSKYYTVGPEHLRLHDLIIFDNEKQRADFARWQHGFSHRQLLLYDDMMSEDSIKALMNQLKLTRFTILNAGNQTKLPQLFQHAHLFDRIEIPEVLFDEFNERCNGWGTRELRIESGEGFTRIYELTCSLPQFIKLSTAVHMTVLPDPEKQPNLEDITVTVDKKGVLLHRLADFHKLRMLALLKIKKEHDIFKYIKETKIGFLRLYRGDLETLNGIEEVTTLTDLWFQEFRNLRDISALAKLPLLEELSIGYCNDFVNGETLLQIPKLSHLSIWDSKHVASKEVGEELKKKLKEASFVMQYFG